MNQKCVFCREQVDFSKTYCSNCGESIIKGLSEENFQKIFVELAKRNIKNDNLLKYLDEHYVGALNYSIYPSKNEINVKLGSCMVFGYRIRETESFFGGFFKYNYSNIKHNTEIQEFLNENTPEYYQIVKIAKYMEQNNTKLGLGEEVERYSVFGFETTKRYFDSFGMDFHHNILPRIVNLCHDKDWAVESIARNMVLGYCFKLAEEILENELPF